MEVQNDEQAQSIKNLIRMKNETLTLTLLEKIKSNERVLVSLDQTPKGKCLVWNEKKLFIFDVCQHGNAEYNVVSVIRDLLKRHHPEIKWTRKQVEPLVWFEPLGKSE